MPVALPFDEYRLPMLQRYFERTIVSAPEYALLSSGMMITSDTNVAPITYTAGCRAERILRHHKSRGYTAVPRCVPMCCSCCFFDMRGSEVVSCQTHNLEAPGSSPGWSTLKIKELRQNLSSFFICRENNGKTHQF